MPYLRVVRDKRGYETTYLLHAPRDGSHQESRVIYVFRSPGGVRVGRHVFDSEIRREIERQHPGIPFDWDAMVSAQHVIDAAPPERRPRRRPNGTEAAQTPPPARRPEPQPQPPRLAVPAVIEGDSPERKMRFLADWHGILCEQLPQRIAEPERRETAMSLVQRLNPAGWIDPDEIAAGLSDAAEALERLSRVLSKRRRKPRRSGRGTQTPVATSEASVSASEVEVDAGGNGRSDTESDTGSDAESSTAPEEGADGAMPMSDEFERE